VRNIDAAIRDRQQTIDELAKRVGSIRLSTPGRSREGSAAPRSITKESNASPGMSTINSTPVSFDAPEDVLAEAEAALDTDYSHIKDRFKTLKIARLTQASSKAAPKRILLHTSLANGPIMIDALPLPGSEPERQAKLECDEKLPKISTPRAASNPVIPAMNAAPAFGAIKLSLDPGSSPVASSFRSPRVSAHRTHTPAAKLSSPPNSGTTPSSNIAFELPSSASPAPPSAPSGFFR